MGAGKPPKATERNPTLSECVPKLVFTFDGAFIFPDGATGTSDDAIHVFCWSGESRVIHIRTTS